MSTDVPVPVARSCIGVGSAGLSPLAAHGVGCLVAGLNLETGQVSHHYIAEISLNVTLNITKTKPKLLVAY